MKTETRELYCYTTGTEPFKSRYENLSTEMVSLSIAIRGLVKDAIGQYGKDYGNGNGFEIFSAEDFMECVYEIINDVKEREGVYVMDEYTREFLSKFDNPIFEASEITEWRKPSNGIEEEGVLWMAAKWIEDNLYEETMQGAYDNIHGWRDNYKGGSFNCDDNFELYDRKEILEISDVILSGNCVYLEVWNSEIDKAVAYIGIN